MEDKDAKVDIGGLEEYSGNIKKYGNGLSLGNVDGYSDKVRVFMQALKVKLTSLKTYIETYSDHITTHMEDLLEIERTIGENFDNSLCGSAFVTDFLTRSNYGVAVGNDQKYCFNGSFDSICIVLAINKIISNAAKEDCTNIFDGVDEVLFSEDLKNDIENLYNNDKANFKNNIYKAFDEENLSGITSIINNVLDAIGTSGLKQKWIGGNTLSPYSIAIIYFWQQLGYLVTVFIAGLKMIPGEVLEAVEIDGASFVQKTMYVTIPMMKSTISTVAVLIITGVFKIFEIVQQTTGGGPNHLSETLVTYSYSMTFNSGDYGYGMSLATFTFLLSLVITGIYSILTRERGE